MELVILPRSSFKHLSALAESGTSLPSPFLDLLCEEPAAENEALPDFAPTRVRVEYTLATPFCFFVSSTAGELPSTVKVGIGKNYQCRQDLYPWYLVLGHNLYCKRTHVIIIT